MAVPNPMTREELLEYAALDALGLLDEYETSLYTRSFHHAPAAVQDEIIQLQAQIVTDETLLSAELPAPSLRERVLNAVAEAIERDAAQLEPLATIGRSRSLHHAPPTRFRLSASGQFWRAAAFALCAGLIVAAYLLADISAKHNQIAVLALSGNTDTQIRELERLIGPTFKDYLFNPASKAQHFKPTGNASSELRATLFLVEGAGEGFLIVEGLAPAAQPYELVVKDAAGVRQTVTQFASSGNLTGIRITLSSAIAQLQNVSWEITDATGVLMATV